MNSDQRVPFAEDCSLMPSTDIDFDEWAHLARTNPESFETRRRDVIACYLACSSERQRQMGCRLQREIDHVRNRAENPDAAFQAVAKMLCEQVHFLGECLACLQANMERIASPRRRPLHFK